MLKLNFTTTSMVTHNNLQRIELNYESNEVLHLSVDIYAKNQLIANDIKINLANGKGNTYFSINPLPKSQKLTAIFKHNGEIIKKVDFSYKKPLERTIYVMISSHTDIGLHNSQYIQRKNCTRFINEAATLCDKTADRDYLDRYRYTVEGTWFWNNYTEDNSKKNANKIINNYVKTSDIGVCCAVAGNHTQTYGLEEMCRSAYERYRLLKNHKIKSETMTMIDNNGMSMAIIGPYCEAGYKNIIFSPNQWNPLPSTIWKTDYTKQGSVWNTDAGGGGSRIDIRYSSELPMLFFWEDDYKNRLLVWGAPQYENGSAAFGLYARTQKPLCETEDTMAKQLPNLDRKYPYEVWLTVCYADDQVPDLALTDTIKNWNSKWKWPRLCTLGKPETPFDIIRKKYRSKIPVLKGDITGGWYQHPIAAPELLANKYKADRFLPTAEKWSVLASLCDEDYQYPADDFRRAWDYLLYNDEHSYGSSGYQGRRVYETWMQHKDWIYKAQKTADTEINNALKSISKNIQTEDDEYIVFNPTLLKRQELINCKEGYAVVNVPAFGYCKVPKSNFKPLNIQTATLSNPPIIENKFYKIVFSQNGSIKSIFDKELSLEILDPGQSHGANEFIYTNDNHKTFFTPQKANFKIETDIFQTKVYITTEVAHLGAEIYQSVTLPNHEKRIDFDNKLLSIRDMINQNRYYRYLYCAFPFALPNTKRLCHLNGTIAEYGKDLTSHTTDVYMAANEWCACENSDYGVGLIMQDSSLVEFGEIHPDKTDYGNLKNGSQIFCYLANDWLQMHCPGGSHLDMRFRFTIYSYKKDNHQSLTQLSERITNPVNIINANKNSGKFKQSEYSFIKTDSKARLITLKCADNNNGIIARFYGDNASVGSFSILEKTLTVTRNTVDERIYVEGKNNFTTYRLGENQINLAQKELPLLKPNNKKPLPIGSFYTGLITNPLAACGEAQGMLYLLWGSNREKNLSHYKLYRSTSPDFIADSTNHIADVLPEDYVVGRYVDTGLEHHTEYFYRVCAVNKNGVCGEISQVFSAFTKE